MRFKITLQPLSKHPVIPINYQYPLSAVIYGVLAKSDGKYADFLHEKGYQATDSLKRFKLFTFSDLKMRFKRDDDRLKILSDVELIVSFHLPEAAQNFIKGLFNSQEIDIADKKSKSSFKIALVEALPSPFKEINTDEIMSVIVKPISPCIAGVKNSKDEYDFLSPKDVRFPLAIEYNWIEKLKSTDNKNDNVQVNIQLHKTEPKSRLVTIKAFTPQQTKIRGFLNFELELIGTARQIEVLYNSGAGIYNALGMGCLEK